MHQRIFTSWAIIQRSEELVGQWVAHWLEYDIVTQGNSMAHAMEMLVDASATIVMDHLAHGNSPSERDTTPDEYRELLHSILRDGVRVGPKEVLDEDRVRAIAVVMALYLQDGWPELSPSEVFRFEFLMMAFKGCNRHFPGRTSAPGGQLEGGGFGVSLAAARAGPLDRPAPERIFIWPPLQPRLWTLASSSMP